MESFRNALKVEGENGEHILSCFYTPTATDIHTLLDTNLNRAITTSTLIQVLSSRLLRFLLGSVRAQGWIRHSGRERSRRSKEAVQHTTLFYTSGLPSHYCGRSIHSSTRRSLKSCDQDPL